MFKSSRAADVSVVSLVMSDLSPVLLNVVRCSRLWRP